MEYDKAVYRLFRRWAIEAGWKRSEAQRWAKATAIEIEQAIQQMLEPK